MKSLGDVGAGHTLGRYELLVPIAQGGMAVVWAARMKGTRGFQKTVAIKCMLPALSEDAQFEEMFLAEAEVAARIRHPNVCEILDLGEEDGILYIVMEWVDGEPLSTLQKAARTKGGVPIPVATRIALHAAAGLHAAHELQDDAGELVGLVHRDVSPQNILVTYDGVVKIVDFGVAKATSQAEGTHTRAGQVKGKIPFMSPEQAIGRPVDRRTDVFALGIVLYQILVGKHPFRGDNDMATLHAIVDEKPVPTVKSLVPACPESLSAAVAQALEKNVDKRFATMAELARALEKSLAEMTAAGEEHDVGAFVRSVLGERAERRRAALKDALRTADERAKLPPESRRAERQSSVSEVSALSIPSAMNPPVTDTNLSAVTRIDGPPRAPTPTGASAAAFVVPDAASPGGRSKWIFAATGAAALGVAAFLALGRGAREQELGAPVPSAPASASVEAPVVAPPTASALVAPPPTSTPSAEPAASAAPSASASASAAPPPKRWGPRPPTPPPTKPPPGNTPAPGGGVMNPGF
jgi:serine/threonine-protein kinase